MLSGIRASPVSWSSEIHPNPTVACKIIHSTCIRLKSCIEGRKAMVAFVVIARECSATMLRIHDKASWSFREARELSCIPEPPMTILHDCLPEVGRMIEH
jgi:hypothetical protein